MYFIPYEKNDKGNPPNGTPFPPKKPLSGLNLRFYGEIAIFQTAALASNIKLWTRYLADVLVLTLFSTLGNKIQKNPCSASF